MENFDFDKKAGEICGYSFPCENPQWVMCIIHGIGEHAGRYQRMAEALNARGIAVLSMDLRGHGRSSGKRGHAAPRRAVLADIDALIDIAVKMYPEVPITLYGHSMGGNIGLDYLCRGAKNQVPKKYIISAPWIRLVRPVTGPLYGLVKMCSKIAPTLSIASACEEEDLGNPQYVRPYKDDPLVHDKVTMLCAYEGFSIGRMLEEGTLPNNHGADDKPLLLMHGDGDKICDINGTRRVSENFKKTRKNFMYKEWKGHYHEIHNGGPNSTGDEVIEEIGDFILK